MRRSSTVNRSSRQEQTRPRRFTFIVTPNNGNEESPMLPKRNSRLYTELENRGMIKVIEFNERSAEHCCSKIQVAFRDIGLEFCQFYRGDGRLGHLIHAQRYNINNIDMDGLEQYVDSVPCVLIYSLASGQGGQSGPKKIYIGPIAPQSFVIHESDDEGDLSEPQEQVPLTSNNRQSSTSSDAHRLFVHPSNDFESQPIESISERTSPPFHSLFSPIPNTEDENELPDPLDMFRAQSNTQHQPCNTLALKETIQSMLDIIFF